MRNAEIARKTAETDIRLTLDLDGTGVSRVNTGCGFLDHMLTLFAAHAREYESALCKPFRHILCIWRKAGEYQSFFSRPPKGR